MTSKQLSMALNISMGSTTRRLRSIRERTEAIAAASADQLAPSGRRHCAMRSIEQTFEDWAKLFHREPDAARQLLRDITGQALAS